MTPFSIPSPSEGVWHLGPLPLRAYALCIIAGIVVAVWLGERRWVARGGRPGDVTEVATWMVPFGIIGGRIYHVITVAGGLLRRRRAPGARPVHLEGRPRHLGRHRVRRGGRLDRLPAPGHPAAGLRRRAGAGDRARPGDRPARQLLQPGAVRQGHRPAVGAGDRSGAPPAGVPRAVDLPPDLPLRADLGRRCRGAGDLGRPALPAGPRPGLRPLRRGVHRRTRLDRGPPGRPRPLVPGAAAQRLDQPAGLHRCGRLLRGQRQAAARPGDARRARGPPGRPRP